MNAHIESTDDYAFSTRENNRLFLLLHNRADVGDVYVLVWRPGRAI
jgi:hypothetical protein